MLDFYTFKWLDFSGQGHIITHLETFTLAQFLPLFCNLRQHLAASVNLPTQNGK
jgi:hypothetical protein